MARRAAPETRQDTGPPSGTSVAPPEGMSDYTPDYGRRLVVDLDFETALGAVNRAIREEGLHALARIDVRDHFMRDQRHMFRLYEIIEAWSPDLAVEALGHHLDA